MLFIAVQSFGPDQENLGSLFSIDLNKFLFGSLRDGIRSLFSIYAFGWGL